MTLISMSFKAACLAAVLAGGALLPAGVMAQPAASATQADYQIFAQATDKIQFFETMVTGMTRAAPYNDAAKGLTPGQQEIMAAALNRELRARRVAIIEATEAHAITTFSHDEIARIATVCDKPGAARISAAIMAAAQGHPEVMTALGNDPASLGMSDADQALFERFFEALMTGSNAAGDEIQASLDVAMAEATTPAARATQPTIAPDYAAFRATAEPLRLFDMVDIIIMRALRQNDAAANIPAGKQEAFYAAAERELYARRQAIMDVIMRKAFAAVNHDDIEGLTAITQSPQVGKLGASLVRIAKDEGDPDIYQALTHDPDLGGTAFDDYLIVRYLKLTSDAMGEPADQYQAAIEAARKSVLGH